MSSSVVILFALRQEAGGLVDRLTGVVTSQASGFTVHEGALHERRIVVAQSGPGRDAAGRAAEALIAGHRPAWLISAGFAGGLVDGLQRNDIIRVTQVANAGSDVIDLTWPEGLPTSSQVPAAGLLTVDELISLPEEKRRLGELHAAQIVDMETFAVAQSCHAAGTPFLALRVISDGVDERLPEEVDRLLRQRTTAGRLGAAVGAIFRRPSSVKDLYKLNENALVASDRLAECLGRLVADLPGNLPTTSES